ncbi:hypothetical protein halTADL_2389 [Halohasta litchfieldiae]|nr:hypothetical protein [Halohasta litchfieldiae]ATW89130.1 hypothetical protein halTADL_2389 [Halohasta litchfieldiae]
MRPITKPLEELDGQLKDRSVYIVPVDGFRTDSTALTHLLTHSTHHCLQNVYNKRASMQLFLTNIQSGPIIAFTGQSGYADQPHLEINDIPDLNTIYLPDWNPLSAFLNAHVDKQMDGYALCGKLPKAPIGTLTETNRLPNTPSRTVLDELIELIGTSPYNHLIVLTIRPKLIGESDEEQAQDNSIIQQKIDDATNWFRDKSEANIDQEDRVYYVEPTELIAYSEQQSRPSKPLIDGLTDLSTSDHKYKCEQVGTELAADKIAYASTDIKRHLPKHLFYRTDGKKRTLDLLEQDMDNILQRRKHSDSDV